MNKYLKLIILSTLFLSNSIFAVDGFTTNPAKITPEFASLINNVVKDQNNLEEYYLFGYKAWNFKYNTSLNNDLTALGGKSEQTGIYQSFTTYFDYKNLKAVSDYSKPFYQCVGFVKIASNIHVGHYGLTRYWTKGDKLTSTNLPASGTVIATFFGENGVYGGHTAIFVSGNSQRIYVIDQNADGTGTMKYHALPFDGGDTANSAGNYHIVEI